MTRTPKLSYVTEMVRRVIAMVEGLPIDSDLIPQADVHILTPLSKLLQTDYADIEQELRISGVLGQAFEMTPRECVETLQWVLIRTGDAIEFLRVLGGKHTLSFLQDGDRTVGLFDDKHLAFFKDVLGKRPVWQRLEVAKEAVGLSGRSEDAKLDFLYFARDVVEAVKYEPTSPAHHRRNLVAGSLTTLIDYEVRHAPQDIHVVTAEDVQFGIGRMLGRLSFPPSIRARLDALRRPGDERSDMMLLDAALQLLKGRMQLA